MAMKLPEGAEAIDKGVARVKVTDVYAAAAGESTIIIVEFFELEGRFKATLTIWLTEKAWSAFGQRQLAACGWDAAMNDFDVESLLRDRPIIGNEAEVKWVLVRRPMKVKDGDKWIDRMDADGNVMTVDEVVVEDFVGSGRKRLDIDAERGLVRGLKAQLRMWSGMTSKSPQQRSRPASRAPSQKPPGGAGAVRGGVSPAGGGAGGDGQAGDDDIPF